MKPQMTMLDLVTFVAGHTSSEGELIATVVGLVNSGAVGLCGSFRGTHFDVAAIAQPGLCPAVA